MVKSPLTPSVEPWNTRYMSVFSVEWIATSVVAC